MKRSVFWIPAVGVLILAACGPADLDVYAEVDRTDPETGDVTQQPVERLRVQALPFDRDHVFDSLAAEHPDPEPQLPAEVEEARQEMQAHQEAWREAESRWADLRSQLQQISDEMQDYAPAETRYQELFAQFEELEGQYQQAEQEKDEAFENFTSLQSEIFDELEEHRLAMEAWEEEAFADYGEVVARYEEQTGRQMVTDTTDAQGYTRMRLDPGEWWVHARYRLTHSELYWNVPVTLEREDEPTELRLTRENAEERPVH